MVIGNKGAKIKTIGIEARKDMQGMFEAAGTPRAVGQSEIRLGRLTSAPCAVSVTLTTSKS